MAARRLGFKLKHVEDGELHRYVWCDLMNNGASHICEAGKDKKSALSIACKFLADYISCPTHQKSESPS